MRVYKFDVSLKRALINRAVTGEDQDNDDKHVTQELFVLLSYQGSRSRNLLLHNFANRIVSVETNPDPTLHFTNFKLPAAKLPNALGLDAANNQLQPGRPFATAAAPDFGVLNRTAEGKQDLGSGRQIQFGLSFDFLPDVLLKNLPPTDIFPPRSVRYRLRTVIRRTGGDFPAAEGSPLAARTFMLAGGQTPAASPNSLTGGTYYVSQRPHL